MPNILDRLEQLWSSIKVGKSKERACFTLMEAGPAPFTKQQHYFQIVLNEMYLAAGRKWFVEYDPVAVVATTYKYGSEYQTAPAVVGPALLQQHVEQLPNGAIIRDAPVTNLSAYTGGALTFTIFLNAVQRVNNAEKMLSMLESISSVASPVAPAIPFDSYLKIAGSVMDSVKTLLGLDATEPLLAYRVTINPDIGQTFAPSYIVMIDADPAELHNKQFRVENRRLVEGAAGQPYRDHSFLLLQIAQGVQRTDEETLTFYPLWQRTRDFAAQAATAAIWNDAKAHFNTLKRALLDSPDLTRPDYTRLLNHYLVEIKALREEAVLLSDLHGSGGEEPATPEAQQRHADEQTLQQVAQELDALDNL